MANKPTTASVAKDVKELAMKSLAARKKSGSISKDEGVLSIADHGEYIMVYTGKNSFGVRKNAGTSKTG